MLYKKNDSASLSASLFAAPGAEYRGAPFWAWNTTLEKDELLRQIDVFREMGIGGFHMHSRAGMATEYLSDDFMALVRACCDKAKAENMLCWLYDEDRWPSGFAGGLVTADYRWRARTLVLSPEPDARLLPDTAALDAALTAGGKPFGCLLARYRVTLDADGYLTDCALLADGEEAENVWYASLRIAQDSPRFNNAAYLDTLSPAAVRRFIEVTYDRYYEAVGDEFGKTVPAIFTDEPQFARRQFLRTSGERRPIAFPWTDDFEETYRAAYGESLLARLPELVWELPDGKLSTARYRYADHLCERFAAAFVDQIGAWCEAHHIAFTGHMMQEPTLDSQSGMIGEAMRCYRGFQIPGIDMLCGRVELTTAKQTQSAVHQYGREGMLSELYGVTGWEYDFRSHKEQGDWQAALGVTVRVHHLTWVSMNGEAKRDYPATIGYQSPWYKKYSAVEDHFARLNTALTRGRPHVRIGVVHPIESYWLHCGPQDKTFSRRAYLDEQFQTLTRTLLTRGLDFDFLCESLLPSLCPEAANPLVVGKMAYDVVVVPVMETMRATTLERLKAFAAAGGQVILLGAAPALIDAVPSDAAREAAAAWTRLEVDYNALIDALAPYRFLDLRDVATGARLTTMIHQAREDGDGRWLFVCHAEPVENTPLYMPAQSSERVRLTLRGRWDVKEYDTLTGEIRTPRYTVRGDETALERVFYAADSLLLWLTPHVGEDAAVAGDPWRRPLPGNSPNIRDAAAKVPGEVVELPVTLKDPAEYTLSEPNALLLDRAAFAFDGGAYEEEIDSILIADVGRKRFFAAHQGQRVVQPWVPVPEEVKNLPPHTVRRRFTFETEIPVAGAHLALEMPEAPTRIWLCGREVAAEPDGWYVDHCLRTVPLPTIPAGEVTIEIEQPFSLRSCTEWCYLTGDFGVRLTGRYAAVTARAPRLAFGDAAAQTLPFYTGNITYHCFFDETDGTKERVLRTARFGGVLVSVRLDGGEEQLCPYPPYCVSLGTPSRGRHTVEVTVYGHRRNAFGPVHNCVPGYSYWGPQSWRTHGTPGWTDSYVLKPTGLLDAPEVR